MRRGERLQGVKDTRKFSEYWQRQRSARKRGTTRTVGTTRTPRSYGQRFRSTHPVRRI